MNRARRPTPSDPLERVASAEGLETPRPAVAMCLCIACLVVLLALAFVMPAWGADEPAKVILQMPANDVPAWLQTVLGALGSAVAVYAGIRADMARMGERAAQAMRAAARAHQRIDALYAARSGGPLPSAFESDPEHMTTRQD